MTLGTTSVKKGEGVDHRSTRIEKLWSVTLLGSLIESPKRQHENLNSSPNNDSIRSIHQFTSFSFIVRLGITRNMAFVNVHYPQQWNWMTFLTVVVVGYLGIWFVFLCQQPIARHATLLSTICRILLGGGASHDATIWCKWRFEWILRNDFW